MSGGAGRGGVHTGSALGSLFALVCVLAVSLLSPVPSHAVRVVDGPTRPFTPRSTLSSATADQGLATVLVGHDGRMVATTVTRGHGSIPTGLRAAGWVHIGDPAGYGPRVFDAYQAGPDARAKLFTVSAGRGPATRLFHRLVRGESFHNSFAAVAPGGRLLVAGEWGTESRLLVFALPSTLVPGSTRNLRLTGIIALSHPMRDVQGCAFRTATALLCSTNDPGTDLFPVPRQLILVRLGGTPGPGVTPARPVLVTAVPDQTICRGETGEVEGIDVAGTLIRVLINAPCRPLTQLFSLTIGPVRSGPPDIDITVAWLVPARLGVILRGAGRRAGQPAPDRAADDDL